MYKTLDEIPTGRLVLLRNDDWYLVSVIPVLGKVLIPCNHTDYVKTLAEYSRLVHKEEEYYDITAVLDTDAAECLIKKKKPKDDVELFDIHVDEDKVCVLPTDEHREIMHKEDRLEELRTDIAKLEYDIENIRSKIRRIQSNASLLALDIKSDKLKLGL